MKTDELNYYLPPELIAQHPLDARSNSKLLVFNRSSDKLEDSSFNRIGSFLHSGDCLVLNNTKVLPARFFGRRGNGGKFEALYLAETSPGLWEVMLKGARKIKTGEVIHITDGSGEDFCRAEIAGKAPQGKCKLKIRVDANAESILEKIGFPPLPPYIKRDRDLNQAAKDKLSYQTVYAEYAGAIAAPTAGLHFTNELIGQLKQAGICFAYITLHVGEGTFRPVTTDILEEHKMHEEQFSIDDKNAQIINNCKKDGGRIIAVGTTSVRTLETLATNPQIKGAKGKTDLFIKPGYEFKIVDAMITNFHLPKSTLLAMVAAFAGLKNVLSAYKHAVGQKYRFYSYGDAMLII